MRNGSKAGADSDPVAGDPGLAVVVPTRDPQLLDLCLRAHTRFTPAGALFVVTDTSATVDAAADLRGVCDDARTRGQRVRLEAGEPSATYSRWNHEAALVAIGLGARQIVFANDDTVVTPDWLRIMREDLDALRRAGFTPGLLGACSNSISGPQMHTGGLGRRGVGVVYLSEKSGDPAAPALFNGPIVHGNIRTQFALVEAAAYEACGGFDLDLPTHYGADDALSYRLLARGFANAISRAFVCHFGSETFVATRIDASGDLARSHAYLRRRYPDMTDRFSAVSPIIVAAGGAADGRGAPAGPRRG